MTRLTYTSGSAAPETDPAFEAALAAARSGPAEPLPHVVAGAAFERHDRTVDADERRETAALRGAGSREVRLDVIRDARRVRVA